MSYVTWRGFKFDQLTINAILLTESLLGYQLTIVQGSFSSSVSASAGTHSGGGAADIHVVGYPTSKKVAIVHALRQAGFAAWHRPYNWDNAGGGEHVHCILIGDSQMSSAAARQIVQWNQGTNGLADHAPDDDSVDVAAGRPAIVTSGGGGGGGTGKLMEDIL